MLVVNRLGMAAVILGMGANVALAGELPVPGPIAGVGLPAVAVALGAYWLIRKARAARGD